MHLAIFLMVNKSESMHIASLKVKGKASFIHIIVWSSYLLLSWYAENINVDSSFSLQTDGFVGYGHIISQLIKLVQDTRAWVLEPSPSIGMEFQHIMEVPLHSSSTLAMRNDRYHKKNLLIKIKLIIYYEAWLVLCNRPLIIVLQYYHFTI